METKTINHLGTVRASSLPELLDCGFRWYAKNELRLRLPSSPPAHMGQALHAGTAAYDQARLEGQAVKPDDAAGVFVDHLHRPPEDVEWGDSSPKKLEPVGLRVLTHYCTDLAPQRTYEAVELRCEALDVVTEYGTVRLTGTTDRIRRTADGRRGISDLKTGARAVGTDGRAVTKGHGLQMGIYSLLAEQASGQAMDDAAEIVGLQTTQQARVGVGRIEDVRTPLVGTPNEPGIIDLAAQTLNAGLFIPNPRSNLCNPKYCPARRENGGPCHWHE